MTTQLRGISNPTFANRLRYAIRDKMTARAAQGVEPFEIDGTATLVWKQALAGVAAHGGDWEWLQDASDQMVRDYAEQSVRLMFDSRPVLAA